ncbi:MAG: tandem-95 repeat protein, partial [Gammaproteobacteria bacterium]
VLANDTDTDLPNDSMSVVLVEGEGPSHGTLTLNENGTFSYTHDGSENFSDSFTYEVSDAAGASSQAMVSITIDPVNDNAPAGNADDIEVDEGGTAAALVGGASSVLDNDIDTDLPNDTLTVDVTPVSGPTHGTLTLNLDGRFSYMHDGSENFSDSFIYELSDAAGATSQATVNIIINPVNDNGPSDIQLVDENGNVLTEVSVDENAADGTFIADILVTDPDGNSDHTITLVDDGGGAFGLGSIVVADGDLLDYEQTNTRQVTLLATDSNGSSLEKTFTIALNDIFDTPTVPVNNPLIGGAENSSAGSETGNFSPDTTSTAEHISDTVAGNQDGSDPGTDGDATQFDIGSADALAVLSGDPTQALDAPGAGDVDPDTVPEDGTATGEESRDDTQEASAKGEATQEAEGRTPLSKEVKKQSEQFEAQRKEILELFEDFGKQAGCGA